MERGRKFVETFLQHVTDEDESMDAFDKFNEDLVMSLKNILDNSREYKSISTKREKLWCEFHCIRLHTLPAIWKHCYRALDIPHNQLVAQTVNLKLFESLLRAYFAKNSDSKAMMTTPTPSSTTSFSDDELNVLRYVAVYVPYSLLKRHERNHQTKPAVLECLGNMAVAGDDSDIHNYTTKWIEIVNREGLFPVNDKSFQLFIAIESTVVQTLSSSYTNTA